MLMKLLINTVKENLVKYEFLLYWMKVLLVRKQILSQNQILKPWDFIIDNAKLVFAVLETHEWFIQ